MKKLLRILLLTCLFCALLIGLYQLTQPLDRIGSVSLYNHLFPGRERLPFGETPQTAYNFSLNSLNAMFASHKISGTPKTEGKFRIAVIGDSSAWGTLLRPEETFAGQLDGKTLPDGRIIECFNLAYPTLSLSKDLLLLNRALSYEPDLVIWSLTMESFPNDKQSDNALLDANRAEFEAVYGDGSSPKKASGLLFAEERRDLADILRLQLYGPMWAGTGIDQDYSEDYVPPQRDLKNDNTFHGYEGTLPEDALDWDLLEKGILRCGDTPLLIVNEPMLISDGENSDIRYNFYYPREAYDAWHAELSERIPDLLDLWDLLSVYAFTNSAIHYNAEGAETVARMILEKIGEN